MWIDIYADSDEKNLFSGTGGDGGICVPVHRVLIITENYRNRLGLGFKVW